SRPVRIIAPTGPAGAPDILARLIAPWLSERLGQQFVVENRQGGGSNIGTEAVVRAPPDGCTLLLVSTTNTINATLYDRLNFDFLRDIAPVAPHRAIPGSLRVIAAAPGPSHAARLVARRRSARSRNCPHLAVSGSSRSA